MNTQTINHSAALLPERGLAFNRVITTEKSLREFDGGPLSSADHAEDQAIYNRAIENFVGTVKVPLGIAGPLYVHGDFASGIYYVPLATTEATLVASYSRDAAAISEAGGCTTALIAESISRVPGFVFADLREAMAFAEWVADHVSDIRRIAEATSAHGKFIDLKTTVEGNHVYLHLNFSTGEAAGQNMVTIAADAVCDYAREAAPVRPRNILVESNASGDKKASALSLTSVRGKRVAAEVVLPAPLVRRRLGVAPEILAENWRLGALGSVLAGTIGIQCHFANGLAALYIACGQDAACVAESAVGITRFELSPDGGLYASVTLPNIVVGTVGGGTGLPSQRACLDIMGLSGPDSARALAEICAGLCLAGELSISAAMCAGQFTRAHQVLGRLRARQSRSRLSACAAGASPAFVQGKGY